MKSERPSEKLSRLAGITSERAPGQRTRARLLNRFAWILLILGIIALLKINSCAQEVPVSGLNTQESVTKKQLAEEATTWRETLRRALDKVEAQKLQIAEAEALMKLLQNLIDSLARRDEFRVKEIEALRNVIAAHDELKQLQAQRAELAE